MLQLSEKWVRCESISVARPRWKPQRRQHESPPLQKNVKVGQPPPTLSAIRCVVAVCAFTNRHCSFSLSLYAARRV